MEDNKPLPAAVDSRQPCEDVVVSSGDPSRGGAAFMVGTPNTADYVSGYMGISREWYPKHKSVMQSDEERIGALPAAVRGSAPCENAELEQYFDGLKTSAQLNYNQGVEDERERCARLVETIFAAEAKVDSYMGEVHQLMKSVGKDIRKG